MAKRSEGAATASRSVRRAVGGRASEPVRQDDRAVYIISVAAELAGVHPQTLRIYERKGLLTPARTAGNTRRYSESDIARLQMIQRLTQDHGLNLAGVKMIVEMENELDRMKARVNRLDRELEQARVRMRDEVDRLIREFRRPEIVPLSTVRRLSLQVGSSGGQRDRKRGPIPMGPAGSIDP
jgi:MerR family transcriptional regulator/heat shock protein HspR